MTTQHPDKDPRRAPRTVDVLGPGEVGAVWLSISRRLIFTWRATGWHWLDGNRWIPDYSSDPAGPFIELRDWIEPEPSR
jgi:hypothetical protein